MTNTTNPRTSKSGGLEPSKRLEFAGLELTPSDAMRYAVGGFRSAYAYLLMVRRWKVTGQEVHPCVGGSAERDARAAAAMVFRVARFSGEDPCRQVAWALRNLCGRARSERVDCGCRVNVDFKLWPNGHYGYAVAKGGAN